MYAVHQIIINRCFLLAVLQLEMHQMSQDYPDLAGII
jgi:hypothetical protein